MLEPYRGEDGAWEWVLMMMVGNLFRASSIETFLLGLALLMALLIGMCTLFVLQIVGTYLWRVYKTHGFGSSRTARILQVALVCLILVWISAATLYSTNKISWEVEINLRAFSFLLFSLTLVAVDHSQGGVNASQDDSDVDVNAYINRNQNGSNPQP